MLGATLALATASTLAARAWLSAYLHGAEFQKFVAARLSESLHAEVECLPFRFEGMTLHCDGVNARGYEGSPFAEGRITGVSARFNLRGIVQGAWKIEELRAERLSLQLDGTRLALPPSTTGAQRHGSRQHAPGLLPDRLEVARGQLDSLEIFWGTTPDRSGSFRKTESITFARRGLGSSAWDFAVKGGELITAGLPPLSLTEAKAEYRQKESMLAVSEANFVGVDGGTVALHGDVRFGQGLDLQAHLTGIDLAPMLSGDWRLRLHGKMNGDVRVQSALPAGAPPSVTGIVSLSDARLEAFPVLNAIAALTRVQQFRDLPLTRVSGAFHHEGEHLEITDLVAESEGRLRTEGAVTLQSGEIDGTFQVGVPPALLEWIPGAQARVFTTARNGYAWTPMRLTGPVDAPKEDLSGRLIAAAGDTVLEKVENSANDLIERTREAAKSALELLFPTR